ncbi:MAG TPA: hypothetical protein VNZ26_34450 [Vicinamibacterales bacterium]|nr:hypothetical protein [Vicinamibacterales bacterium]
MTCREYRELLVDLVRGEIYEPSRVHAALQHSRACTACATELHRQRSLQVSLRLLAVDCDVDPPAHLESKLLRAARGHFRLRTKETLLRRGAMAAASVAAVVTLVVVWSHVRPVQTTARPATGVLASTNVPNGPNASIATLVAGPTTRRLTRRPQSTALAGNRVSAETRSDSVETRTAEGFVPFGYAGDLGPVERTGQIVRVELPIDTLISVGPPIVDPTTMRPRTVQADIWVGQDGIARAVRLIGSTPRR